MGEGARAMEEVAKRSLVGLVTFLTTYFRYLSNDDAMYYICLARADLLVAIRRIQDDHSYRGKAKFSICSLAVKTALKCAALSARQANIDAFLTSSYSVAYHLCTISEKTERHRCRGLSVQDVLWLSGFLRKPNVAFKFNNSLAAARSLHYDGGDAGIEEGIPGLTDLHIRALLTDAIHTEYLKAISRMPTEELRRCHYRGLHKAGYCFGPLDPASNIIINTIWYDTTFPAPASEQLDEVDMTCTGTMPYIESRSLDVLIKLLQECILDISVHDAMVYLLKSNLRLRKAIRMAIQKGRYTSTWTANVYKAAVVEAFHPQPEAFMVFIMQTLPMVRSSVKNLLKPFHVLSSSEVIRISRLLLPSDPPISHHPTDELSKDALEMVLKYKENFINEQDFVREKVKAALHKYEQTTGHRYELHFICGQNKYVGMKTPILDFSCPYYYSHVNFWSILKDETSPRLFFAEFRNHEDNENQQSFCCPFPDGSVNARCCYCEHERARIVHAVWRYCGGVEDFELIASGEHHLTNKDIVSNGSLMDAQHYRLTNGIIFIDPTRDAKLIQLANHSTWVENLDIESADLLAEAEAHVSRLSKHQDSVFS